MSTLLVEVTVLKAGSAPTIEEARSIVYSIIVLNREALVDHRVWDALPSRERPTAIHAKLPVVPMAGPEDMLVGDKLHVPADVFEGIRARGGAAAKGELTFVVNRLTSSKQERYLVIWCISQTGPNAPLTTPEKAPSPGSVDSETEPAPPGPPGAEVDFMKLLGRGVAFWNEWRSKNRDTIPSFVRAQLQGWDLRRADLSNCLFGCANLSNCDLGGADLSASGFPNATLTYANLNRANCDMAKFFRTQLNHTNLTEANLFMTYFEEADLSDATVIGANLMRAVLVNSTCKRTVFLGCRVHGLSVWDVDLDGAEESGLNISPIGQEEYGLTVDSLELAQFVSLLLNNKNIKRVIDTISMKAVLILGSFDPSQKELLERLRHALRRLGYLPIVFDFLRPGSRDLTETVSTLAHLVRFIIADLTSSRSVPHELQAVVPHLLSVPVQPIIHVDDTEPAMFAHITRYPQVLPLLRYRDSADLLARLENDIAKPAEVRVKGMAPE